MLIALSASKTLTLTQSDLLRLTHRELITAIELTNIHIEGYRKTCLGFYNAGLGYDFAGLSKDLERLKEVKKRMLSTYEKYNSNAYIPVSVRRTRKMAFIGQNLSY